MDRRKHVAQQRRTALQAIRDLFKKEEMSTANKILFDLYRKGWIANQQGQNRFTNPYPVATPYWEQWNRGWLECSKILKRRSSDFVEGQLPHGGKAFIQKGPTQP